MADPVKLPRLSKVGRPKASDSAKKRNKAATNKIIARSRIFIGKSIGRWMDVKERTGVKSHAELAELLLDRYDERIATAEPGPSKAVNVKKRLGFPLLVSSTPLEKKTRVQMLREKDDESSTEKSSISSICPLPSESYGSTSDSPRQQSPVRKKKVPPGFSASFIDPFELSIDVYQDSDSNVETDEDDDYEPSYHICLGPVNDNICEASYDEEFFPTVEDEVEELSNEIAVDGVRRFKTDDEAAAFGNEKMYICSQESLMILHQMEVVKSCRTCNKPVNIQQSTVGSALYFKWVCEDGHKCQTWCSQPILRRGVHSGDLRIAAAVLFSGNNFQKISMMADFLNMAILSVSSYSRFQTAYLVPTVEHFWNDHVQQLLERRRGQDIVILGDGRMDSPGHSAQYCTYTVMENVTKEILSVVTVDKRETGKSSVRMEKEAFLRTLDHLDTEEVNVSEVVTDAHASIAAHLRKECPQIKHSFDVWHVAKNLAKKIMKAGQQRQCADLKGWCKHIVNHFYHTCTKATDMEEFTGIWFGLLHHVVDEHEWHLATGSNITSCQHGPLTGHREMSWLTKGSTAHDALRNIVADKRFLKQIPYYLNARSTAELEGFNNLILMYAGKRFSYIPTVYRARNLLAALDHNCHLNRPTLMNKDGVERVHKIFNKKSGQWLIKPVKERKTYVYKTKLMENVVRMRMTDKKSLSAPVVLEQQDPRLISPSIAQLASPPTEMLRQQQISRFREAINEGQN